ncbi:MAG: putative peptidoglycan binding domain [Variibacter sp.]|jgi:peptidoglycan hydrolase-like protein with peptidoglycan-binding domain|nr:putative peptidoglycan binding domain [Variibacter sp.]
MLKTPIKPGDAGNMVTALQYALMANGYTVGPARPSGTFDEQTLTALAAFQDSNALPVQPFCDNQAWSALLPQPTKP